MNTSGLWTIDRLEQRLKARAEIKSYVLKREQITRMERYFLKDDLAVAIDQDRSVSSLGIDARIFVHLTGKPGKQGEASQRFFPERDLESQIDRVIRTALQTESEAWTLPNAVPPENARPQLETCDPMLAEDLPSALSSMTQELVGAVQEIESTATSPRFHSAELFMAVHDTELKLSNGLSHRSSQSRIYLESAFSYGKGQIQDEYMQTRWAVHRDEISVAKLLKEAAERSRMTVQTVKPQPGKYSVLLDAEVLSNLFHEYLTHLSGGNTYHGLPHLAIGSALIPEAKAGSADLMSWSLDPSLSFGAATAAFSGQGILQKPLELVRDNQVQALLLDQQYATYLKRDPGTSRGNLVITGGTKTRDELLQSQDPVLEVLQFSGLFVDAPSATFSSELRLALLHRRDKAPLIIKGGSLSGSIPENFARARFSKNAVRFSHFGPEGQGYYGPEFALLNDVSIAG